MKYRLEANVQSYVNNGYEFSGSIAGSPWTAEYIQAAHISPGAMKIFMYQLNVYELLHRCFCKIEAVKYYLFSQLVN